MCKLSNLASQINYLSRTLVREKRPVPEIELSQPMHETAFWWRHNAPVASQLTDPIKWPKYPLKLIGIYVHINTHNKQSLTQRCRRSTNLQLCLIFCIYLYGLSLNGWHAWFCITNNRHDLTITTHAIMRHFLIRMSTVRQPTKRRCSSIFTLTCTFICVYWCTRQRIHNTLIVWDGGFVAGIDLPQNDSTRYRSTTSRCSGFL